MRRRIIILITMFCGVSFGWNIPIKSQGIISVVDHVIKVGHGWWWPDTFQSNMVVTYLRPGLYGITNDCVSTNHACLVGDASTVPGVGFVLDGTNDAVMLSMNSAMITGTNFTVSVWLRLTANYAVHELFVQSVNAIGYSIHNCFLVADNGRMGYENYPTSGGQIFSSNNVIPVLVWTHVVVTRDSDTVSFFVNGAPKGEGDSGSIEATGIDRTAFGAFAYYDGYINELYGSMDEILLTTQVMSPEDIFSYYTNSLSSEYSTR